MSSDNPNKPPKEQKPHNISEEEWNRTSPDYSPIWKMTEPLVPDGETKEDKKD